MCAEVQSPELITQLTAHSSQLTAHSSLAYLIMSTMSRPGCPAPHPYSDVGWLGRLQEALRKAIDNYQRGLDMEDRRQTADLYHLRGMLVAAYDDMREAWDCCVCPATIQDKVLDTIYEARLILKTAQPARPPSPGYTEPGRVGMVDDGPDGTTCSTVVGGIAFCSDGPTPGVTPCCTPAPTEVPSARLEKCPRQQRREGRRERKKGLHAGDTARRRLAACRRHPGGGRKGDGAAQSAKPRAASKTKTKDTSAPSAKKQKKQNRAEASRFGRLEQLGRCSRCPT